MHLEHLLVQLTGLFGVAVVVVLLLGRLGLPPIAGFLLAGILVGPGGFGLVGDPHEVEVVAELGVALLLLTIGLEFSLARLRHIARHVVLGGGLQVVLTVAAAVGVAAAFGAPWRHGVFWGFLAALSSTAIVLRALADREETSAPHGRFVVAVLIFQDLCIVPMMLALPMLAGEGGGAADMALTLAKAAAVVVGVLILARGVVPRLLHRVAATRRSELFLLTVLLVAMGVAAATAQMGLSIALGAFLAGVVIADTPFVHQAQSHVGPFRDAFASLFFVSVGMLLDPTVLTSELARVTALFVGLLVGKLVLATLAGLLMRFPVRVAIVAGVGLAQVGEFSFVLLGSGQALGLISPEMSRVFLAASVLSMIAAPLLVAASPRIGVAGAALLRPLERLLAVPEVDEAERRIPLRDHVIVAGLGLGGQLLVQALEGARVPYVAVELDPDTVARERAAGRNVRYGDIASDEVLAHVADADSARLLVILVSDADASRRALAAVRARHPRLPVIVRAHRAQRDEPTLGGPGVEVVSEDYQAALEIVERVLVRAAGAQPQRAVALGALAAARGLRDDNGAPRLPAGLVLGAMDMEALTLAEGDRAVGRTVAATGLRAAGGALIVAVARGDEVLTTPDAELLLAPGDVVFLFGTRGQLDAAREALRGTA